MKRILGKKEFSKYKPYSHIFKPSLSRPNKLIILWRAVEIVENIAPKIDASTKKNFTHSQTGPFKSR